MTTKEIAKIANVSIKTIQRWTNEVVGQNDEVLRQNDEVAKGKTRDFTLEETIAIIRAGGNETLANLLLDNAKPKQENDSIDRLILMIEKMIASIPSIVVNTISAINQPKQLEVIQDYYSISGYCIKLGMKSVSFSEMIAFGKKATALSKQKGIEIRQVSDERYGKVGSYSIQVLEEVFKF